MGIIIQSLYFMIPAYFANMAPVFFKRVKFLNYPVSSKWFGKNKTWRGIFFAVVLGTLVFYLQKAFSSNTQQLNLLDYSKYSILLGVLISAGAIIGDLAESFLKRRLDLKPGTRFFPWDQIDFVVGSLLLCSIIFFPGWIAIGVILLISPALHILTNHIAFFTGIRKEKW